MTTARVLDRGKEEYLDSFDAAILNLFSPFKEFFDIDMFSSVLFLHWGQRGACLFSSLKNQQRGFGRWLGLKYCKCGGDSFSKAGNRPIPIKVSNNDLWELKRHSVSFVWKYLQALWIRIWLRRNKSTEFSTNILTLKTDYLQNEYMLEILT